MLAIILIGAIASAVVFATTEDTLLVSTGSAREMSTLAAESALASLVSAQGSSMPDSIGVSHTTAIHVDESSRCVVVYVTRLDSTTLWIVADVLADAAHYGARRRLGVIAAVDRRADGTIGIAPISLRSWSELF